MEAGLPWIQLTAGWLGFGAMLLTVLRVYGYGWKGKTGETDWSAVRLWLALAVSFFLLRLPSVLVPSDTYTDESAFIAESVRCLKHPVPWKDIDSFTSGPLNYWILALPVGFGAAPSWAMARAVMWAAHCATLFLLYRTLRLFVPRPAALAGIWPTLFLYAFFSITDYTHYNSETVPVLLLAAVGFLAVKLWNEPAKRNAGALFLAGLSLGCLPFAKLQVAPLASFWSLVFLWRSFWLARQGKGWSPLAAFLSGSILVPAVLLSWVMWHGAWQDFWLSYIINALHYRRDPTMPVPHGIVYLLFQRNWAFAAYLALAAILIGLQQGMRTSRSFPRPPEQRPIFWIFWAAACVTVYCILAPGREYIHYLLLLVPSVGLLTGLAIANLTPANLPAFEIRGLFRAFHPRRLVIGLVSGLYMIAAWSYWHNPQENIWNSSQSPDMQIKTLLAPLIRPGDELSIWGWRPALHVITGLPPATRECVSQNVIEAGPQRDYYRSRYLRDFQQARPAFFIDATADGLRSQTLWSKPYDHFESFPEFASFIADNYQLFTTVSYQGGMPLRIYIRRNHLSASPDPSKTTFVPRRQS